MQNLNIFIGSTARRWSEKISGNKLLLGNTTDVQYNDSVLVFENFPTNETKDFSKASINWKEMSNDFSSYINYQRQNNSNYLSKIESLATKYNQITIIVASGGLLGNTFTPLVLSTLKNKNIQLIIQRTNFSFLKEKENLLMNFLKHQNIAYLLIEINEIENKYGNQNLDVVFNILDKLAINQITKLLVNSNQLK